MPRHAAVIVVARCDLGIVGRIDVIASSSASATSAILSPSTPGSSGSRCSPAPPITSTAPHVGHEPSDRIAAGVQYFEQV